MTNKTKKEQIKEKISEYFNIREIIFHNRANQNELKKNNDEKHKKVNEMEDLLNNRELEIIIPKFQEIITNQVEGCDSKKMQVYLTTGSKKYLECLNKQEDAVLHLFDREMKPLVTIIDGGDNIFIDAEQ